ncbi:hypothetical protein TWF225_012073 [Orbilia oligospora]|nr:hypothetical protein TWF225_012073 [Orbilia oligospora]KAF3236504.1 hypothetical protein TWF128_001368 [Orbilia oligospora]KAF3266158.1 hypothetical protein TWF217_001839 [Orbilia oligospora]
MLSIRHVLVCFFFLLTQVSGGIILPIIKSLLAAEAPDAIKTHDPSNQCLSINRGKLLCCTAALSGGFPTVQALSAVVGYPLPADTLNGFLCDPSGTTACPGTQLALCCQVPQVAGIWGLWCQSAL